MNRPLTIDGPGRTVNMNQNLLTHNPYNGVLERGTVGGGAR